MELEGKKVNFLGDSITQGVGVEKAENLYVNRLKEECRFAVVRNYGNQRNADCPSAGGG